ncbi:MAG: glycosyltransferase [Lachnospiraceae bacterium]|nr:glycosyltransferase [Lachnospiraceae bacterium]
MMLKSRIKEQLKKRCDKAYLNLLDLKRVPFDSWIREKEDGLERFDMRIEGQADAGPVVSYAARYEGFSIRILPYEAITAGYSVQPFLEDIIIFVNGELTDRAIPLIVKAFRENPDVSVVYGDEDKAELRAPDVNANESEVYGRTIFGTRTDPYFKPDWSPNAFTAHFYFCNIVAIRRVSFRDIEWSHERSGAAALYHTLLRVIFDNELNLRKSVYHISEVLIHVSDYDCNDLKEEEAERLTNRLKVRSYGPEGYQILNKTMLSVVIPSKDNPKLLEKCLSTMTDACPGFVTLQMIVVDNGSSEENKDKITDLSLKYGFRYEYRPMEFNFSRMCNIGASMATGEYLLLLNDDVYFSEPYVLEEMLKQASYRFAGAVGAKLLYPETGKIQHAGVINGRIGPVHKLQFADDKRSYYFGFNRYTVNVMAVTAACLMLRTEVFEKIGGLNEGLRVAFNDVDLCFRLFESGYYNVCCNNVALCHAESVSRGKDTDPESLKRLLREKDMLYSEHPVFKAVDPFFSKYLLNDCLDTRIVPANEYEYTAADSLSRDVKSVKLDNAREDACVLLNVEYAGKYADYTYEKTEDSRYFIEGFAFVTGSDNACFKGSIILKNDRDCFEIKYNPVLREDVAANCPDQENVELSGFAAVIDAKTLPVGNYRIGIMQSGKNSREKIYCFSERELVVE